MDKPIKYMTHTTNGRGERIAITPPIKLYWSQTLGRYVTVPE